MARSDSYTDEAYVALGPGAELLGVHPTTLRLWADEGRVPVYRTPTNQRRFLVRELRDLLRPEQSGEPDPSPDDQPDPADSSAAAS